MKEIPTVRTFIGSDYVFPKGVTGYIVGLPEEVKKVPLGEGKSLREIAITREDSLLIWYGDVSDRDDDFLLVDRRNDRESFFAIDQVRGADSKKISKNS